MCLHTFATGRVELTRRTGRKEGSLQDNIGQQTAFLPRPAGEAGRGGHVGELQRSCRNSNPVANILESSNQRDRLSRNVLVNTTLTVPGFENTAAPLKSGLEVGHLPVLFSSEACNEKRFQTVFFKKQTTNKQKNHTQAFASQAHFYPWILLHQGHRILPTFCGTVDSVFCFFFLSFYAIRK